MTAPVRKQVLCWYAPAGAWKGTMWKILFEFSAWCEEVCSTLWVLLCFCLCCASLPFLDMSVGKIVMLQQQEQVMLFTVQYGTNNPIEGLWVFSIFFNYFFLFGYRVWRRQAGVAESQCWGVALQDGAKSCRHELVFPGVPGRLNEPKLSSAGFVSLFLSRQKWQFLFSY